MMRFVSVVVIFLFVAGRAGSATAFSQYGSADAGQDAEDRLTQRAAGIPDDLLPLWEQVVDHAHELSRMPTLEEFGRLIAAWHEPLDQQQYLSLSHAFARAQRPSVPKSEVLETYRYRIEAIESVRYAYQVTVGHDAGSKPLEVVSAVVGYDGPAAFATFFHSITDADDLYRVFATNGVRQMTYYREGEDCREPIWKPVAPLIAEIYPLGDYSGVFPDTDPIRLMFPDRVISSYPVGFPVKGYEQLIGYSVYETPVEFDGVECLLAGTLSDHLFVDPGSARIRGRTRGRFRHENQSLIEQSPSFELMVRDFMETDTAGDVPRVITVRQEGRKYEVAIESFETPVSIGDAICIDSIPGNSYVNDTIDGNIWIKHDPSTTGLDPVPMAARRTRWQVIVNMLVLIAAALLVVWRIRCSRSRAMSENSNS